MSQKASLREMLDTLEHGQRDRSSRAMDVTSIYQDDAGVIGRRHQKCLDVLGSIAPGQTKHVVSMGDWSCDNMVAWALGIVGPSDLSFTTWSISRAPASRLICMADDGHILDLYGVFDLRTAVTSAEAIRMMRARFGKVRLYDSHAKVYVLTGGLFPLTIISSGNFTNNPRVEATVICADPEIAEFHREWITTVWLAAEDPFAPTGPEPETPGPNPFDVLRGLPGWAEDE